MNLEELKRLLADATPGPWSTGRGNDRFIWAEQPAGRICIAVLGDQDEGLPSSEIVATGRLIVAAVNALPELIAIAERTKGGALQELMQIDADSYAAGRADQRKADVEIARNLAMTAYARLEGADGDDFAHLNGMVDAGLSIAKAIEEQGK